MRLPPLVPPPLEPIPVTAAAAAPTAASPAFAATAVATKARLSGEGASADGGGAPAEALGDDDDAPVVARRLRSSAGHQLGAAAQGWAAASQSGKRCARPSRLAGTVAALQGWGANGDSKLTRGDSAGAAVDEIDLELGGDSFGQSLLA